MLEILNFVEYIWVSELDSASMQGWLHREAFVPFPSNVAHLLAKAWLCFPNLLPPPLRSWVPLWATCHRVSVRPGLPRLSYSVCVPRTKWGQVSPQVAICPELEPMGKLFGDLKKMPSTFGTVLLASVSYIALPASPFLRLSGEPSPFLPGLSAFISTGNAFSISPQSPGGKELAFHSQLATVWHGRQWE